MKIFVVGSSRHLTDPNDDRIKSFRDFCTALGQRFADEGWTVLVGSFDVGTADSWFLSGMENAAARGKTIDAHIYRSAGVDAHKYEAFELTPHTKFPNMTVAHVSAISECDVVVVVGGFKKTPGAAWAGIALRKPVLLLRQFGGVSAELWNDLHKDYIPILEGSNYNVLSRDDYKIPELCDHTVIACRKLLAAARQGTFSDLAMVLSSGLALASGIGAFLLAAGDFPLAWWRVAVVTVLSVFAGWFLAQVIKHDRKGLVLTLPYAVMLSLVILAVVAMAGKVFEPFINTAVAREKSSELFLSLFGAGLFSGFSGKTALVWWLNELGRKNELGPHRSDE